MYVDTRDGAPDLWLQPVACLRVVDAGAPTDASAPTKD